MKILLIDVYHYYRGGAETVFFNTGTLLKGQGHEVIYFTLKWHENLPSDYSEYFPESKGTRTGVFRNAVNLINYFYHFEAARKLEKLIQDHKPDIAHIHLMWGQLTSSILHVLKKHRIPAILTAHDYRLVCPAYAFRDGKGRICERCRGHKFYHCFTGACSKGKLIESGVMAAEQYFRNRFFNPVSHLSGIIFVSNFSREKHYQYMPDLKRLPTLTLYNMAQEIRHPQPDRSAEKYFLFFGRLSSEKGIGTLLEAIRQLPEYRFKIAGTGPLSEQLSQQAAESGNVEMLGFLRGEALANMISNAMFTFTPSQCYENNPMSIIESYALGTPVIGARIGGIPEIIDDGRTGLLFESGDTDSLVAAIRRAGSMTSGELAAMRDNAIAFAQANFDTANYVSRLTSFYRSVIEQSRNQ
ncbi:MAG: glycosyltransferase family 4 protein [Muribaculaceae bacterium]|nr:glycosyltransferase family 4 protein [Muribaculaceae bacterium]